MSEFDPGQLALVTGAGGDIGRAVARRLCAVGVSVILADLPAASAGLDETMIECERASMHGASATTSLFDVTDAGAVGSALSTVESEIGTPDLLFNNAGYQGEFANTLDVSVEDVQRVLDVNVRGAFTVLQHVARALADAGRPGAIVNSASMAGVSGAPNMAAYSASKAAVIALTKSAAKDLASSGVRVNAVSPGFIGPGTMWDAQVRSQTAVPSAYYSDVDREVAEQMIGQVPLRRCGSVDEVASVVTFLLSESASYLTGVNIEISGGAA